MRALRADRRAPAPAELAADPRAHDRSRARVRGRALVVGWKQAFLEYFADDGVGFDEGAGRRTRNSSSAQSPDPPKDLQLIWEPRYGDVAGSGELGYLTGPVRNILPSRNNGQPRHSTYFSVWKRQRNGDFKVVIDVGVADARSGAVRAWLHPRAARQPLHRRLRRHARRRCSAADGVLNTALRTSQASAYRGRLAPGARLHRHDVLPLVGERAILAWLASQPRYTGGDSRYAEAARSGDLGYTWGTYHPCAGAGRRTPREEGFYARVWVRERNGQWKVALDILSRSSRSGSGRVPVPRASGAEGLVQAARQATISSLRRAVRRVL